MKRTTVYLDEGDKEKLTALAAAQGKSEAELIREGVRILISRGERPRPRTGYGQSTDRRSARDTDKLLTETGFGER